jgi:hypothetical protein
MANYEIRYELIWGYYIVTFMLLLSNFGFVMTSVYYGGIALSFLLSICHISVIILTRSNKWMMRFQNGETEALISTGKYQKDVLTGIMTENILRVVNPIWERKPIDSSKKKAIYCYSIITLILSIIFFIVCTALLIKTLMITKTIKF